MTVANPTNRRAKPSTGAAHRRAARAVRRITVVNDYDDFLSLMNEVLAEHEGHHVATFSSSDASLDDIVGSSPDLLIVDFTVEEASEHAWDITKLRSVQELKETPVILCSADIVSIREAAAEVRRDPRMHFLAKPFTLEELLRTVSGALGGS